ncbi:glycosyltransferase [Sphingomonas antarctica]|uniref:glycosyltransferase family 4 protein n=1 Tax=Sphingomonas antarctica TaxID=2040274 RepID=UPI0039EB40D1
MNDRPDGYDYPAEVVGTIDQDDRVSYSIAAQAITASGVDMIWLQHEYGIFGGSAGEHILYLLDQTDLPLATHVHTVLSDPDPDQRRVMERLVARSARLIVMSTLGRDLLISHYGARPDQVAVIPHGIPDRSFGETATMKARFGFGNRPVILTFGLLSPGKGIDTMIAAMPTIVAAQPDALYVVLGATHPNLVAHEGEAYRDRLIAQTEKLGVSDNVRFIDAFVETDELLDYIAAADIYVTPYLNPAQVTSGTLAYAVGLGKVVVSTPYVHARELLADGVGELVPFGDSAAFADIISGLLSDPARMATLAARTYALGRTMIWPRLAEASLAAFSGLAGPKIAAPKVSSPIMRTIGTAAITRMTDDTGMFQHSRLGVPDRAHGYCIDDNARALIWAVRATGVEPEKRAKWLATYSGFIDGAWNPALATFRNFMAFDRRWLEDRGSDDSVGRTMWALGVTAAESDDASLREWAMGLYEQALPTAAKIESIHARAFIILGGAAVLAKSEHRFTRQLLERFAGELASLVAAERRPDWAWFEIVLAYDNCRLPEALIAAGRVLDRKDWVQTGLATLDWIAEKQTSERGHFRPVGHESFGREYAEPLPFDQQPLEAWATIDACAAALSVTNDAKWRDRALSAWRWYLGDNDVGVPLGDPATGECFDGLHPTCVNRNRGAESILSFQLAAQAMAAIMPRENRALHLAAA